MDNQTEPMVGDILDYGDGYRLLVVHVAIDQKEKDWYDGQYDVKHRMVYTLDDDPITKIPTIGTMPKQTVSVMEHLRTTWKMVDRYNSSEEARWGPPEGDVSYPPKDATLYRMPRWDGE